MKLHWIIGVVVVLLVTSSSGQATAGQPELKTVLDECGKTFADLVERNEFRGLETLCKPKAGDLGNVEFRVSMSYYPPTVLTKSDILAFSDTFAQDGFFLQPTSDPKTFKVGARIKGREDFTYLIDAFGGIFSFAHFVDDRAIWVRCNQQMGVCVYYDDLLREASVTDRWGNHHICNLRWSIVFPSPTADEQITQYMNYILSFIRDFSAANSNKLVLGCLRPSQRIPIPTDN